MLSSASLSIFITLEGIEGCGKSTQASRLVKRLRQEGYASILTREPGGTEVGVLVRRILLDPAMRGIDPLAELLLYCADRAEHTARLILPALAEGKVVLCDRYADATVVYQGYGRRLGPDKVLRVDAGRVEPDLTLLFDVPTDV